MADLYDSFYLGDEKGEAWHGIALKPLLRDITAAQASHEREVGGHSILQLVWHIAYWEEVTLRRFNGEVVDAPLNTENDWPANRCGSDAEWQSALNRLENSHTALRQAIEASSDEKLKQRVPGRNYDNYVLLHGIIHHGIYHSGQVALIKKATSK